MLKYYAGFKKSHQEIQGSLNHSYRKNPPHSAASEQRPANAPTSASTVQARWGQRQGSPVSHSFQGQNGGVAAGTADEDRDTFLRTSIAALFTIYSSAMEIYPLFLDSVLNCSPAKDKLKVKEKRQVTADRLLAATLAGASRS